VLRTDARVLFALFALSGFTGLVYQSIWSHYLKLFLGSAAFAQSFVLAAFMGGMALGAWLASRWGVRRAARASSPPTANPTPRSRWTCRGRARKTSTP